MIQVLDEMVEIDYRHKTRRPQPSQIKNSPMEIFWGRSLLLSCLYVILANLIFKKYILNAGPFVQSAPGGYLTIEKERQLYLFLLTSDVSEIRRQAEKLGHLTLEPRITRRSAEGITFKLTPPVTNLILRGGQWYEIPLEISYFYELQKFLQLCAAEKETRERTAEVISPRFVAAQKLNFGHVHAEQLVAEYNDWIQRVDPKPKVAVSDDLRGAGLLVAVRESIFDHALKHFNTNGSHKLSNFSANGAESGLNLETPVAIEGLARARMSQLKEKLNGQSIPINKLPHLILTANLQIDGLEVSEEILNDLIHDGTKAKNKSAINSLRILANALVKQDCEHQTKVRSLVQALGQPFRYQKWWLKVTKGMGIQITALKRPKK